VDTVSGNIPKEFRMAVGEAEKLTDTHPDSTIKLTDQILKSKDSSHFNNTLLLKIYQLRQQSFARLKRMDSVMRTGERIRAIASEMSDSLAIANSLLLAKGDMEFKEQKKLLVYLPGAINTFSKLNMPFEEARLHANYGAILVQSGDFKLAQTHLLKAYDIMEKLDSIKQLTNISIYIGNNYQRLKSNDLALKYYNKALQFSTLTKDTLTQVSILMNMGIFYNHVQGKTDSTIIYYQQAKKLFPKGGPYYLGMKLDYNMASESIRRKKYPEAELIFKEMQFKCIENNLLEGYAHALSGLSQVYTETNRIPLAIGASKRAFLVFDSLGLKYDAQSEAGNLAGIYGKSGNSQETIKAMNLAQKLKDSLMSVEKQTAVLEIESKYQTEKKEIEITGLKKLSNLRLTMILLLSLAVVILVFMWRHRNKLYREKNFAYTVLMQKYKEEKEIKLQDPHIHIKFKSITAPVKTDSEDGALFLQLTAYYQKEKPYLDSELRAETVAKKLNISARSLAAIVKSNGFTSFIDFTNKFRVEEVKLYLEDPNNDIYKTESLALKSGFGNKHSFYHAFEKFTGLKPNYYRTEISKK
jgi:tetratricopeptide (TPR) repeat protein